MIISKVTSAEVFDVDFNLSCCEFDNFSLDCYFEPFFTDYLLNEK